MELEQKIDVEQLRKETANMRSLVAVQQQIVTLNTRFDALENAMAELNPTLKDLYLDGYNQRIAESEDLKQLAEMLNTLDKAKAAYEESIKKII